MACCNAPLVEKLQCIVNKLEGLQPCMPECPPPPHPICCHPCPPPLVLPTLPEPVKPLMLPVEKCECKCKALATASKPQLQLQIQLLPQPQSQPQEAVVDNGNFYNNYSVDYREQMRWKNYEELEKEFQRPGFNNGVTLDGQPSCCVCRDVGPGIPKIKGPVDKGCPKGFQPCMLKLTPPPDGDPLSPWCAEIRPPKKMTTKPTKKTKKEPEVCLRVCCKHWKPKEGECQYDLPCKAACLNHPPGLKPKHHVPAIDYELLKVLEECFKLKNL